MAKFFLLVELSGLKKRDLKHKCAVTNVNWNNLTFEFLDKDEQNLLGTTSNYLKKFQNISRPAFRTSGCSRNQPTNQKQTKWWQLATELN